MQFSEASRIPLDVSNLQILFTKSKRCKRNILFHGIILVTVMSSIAFTILRNSTDELSISSPKLRPNQPTVFALRHGGSYEPSSGNSTKKVAILVLQKQGVMATLPLQLDPLHRYLIKLQRRYSLFVIGHFDKKPRKGTKPREEYDKDGFPMNWGAHFNAAVLEILKFDTFDCFYFQDLAFTGVSHHITDYRCPDENSVIHYSSITSNLTYKRGFIAISKDDFLQMNGFSSCYLYWTNGESDLAARINNYKFKLQVPITNGRYKIKILPETNNLNKTRLSRDGLNSMDYTLDTTDISKLFTAYKFSFKEKKNEEMLCKL